MDNKEKRSAKSTRQHYKKERRETVVHVRMNEEEIELLDTKRGSRSRSNFLRSVLYKKPIETEPAMVEIPQIDEFMMELNRIGVNANQMARALNTCLMRMRRMGSLFDLSEYKQVESQLEKVEQLIESVDELRAIVDKLREAIREGVRENAMPNLDALFDELMCEEVMSDVDD